MTCSSLPSRYRLGRRRHPASSSAHDPRTRPSPMPVACRPPSPGSNSLRCTSAVSSGPVVPACEGARARLTMGTTEPYIAAGRKVALPASGDARTSMVKTPRYMRPPGSFSLVRSGCRSSPAEEKCTASSVLRQGFRRIEIRTIAQVSRNPGASARFLRSLRNDTHPSHSVQGAVRSVGLASRRTQSPPFPRAHEYYCAGVSVSRDYRRHVLACLCAAISTVGPAWYWRTEHPAILPNTLLSQRLYLSTRKARA
jgi:hypothetical protein